MKVLVNECYGGYGISLEAEELYLKKKKISYELLEESYGRGLYEIDGEDEETYLELSRTDEVLVQVVEEIGSERASGPHAQLAIVEVPDGCQYDIHEYDGAEYINSTWITITIDELKNGLSGDRLELAQKVSCIRVV